MVHTQDIFKSMDIEGKIDYSKLNHKQKKALRNIIECKTEVMGFNTDTLVNAAVILRFTTIHVKIQTALNVEL